MEIIILSDGDVYKFERAITTENQIIILYIQIEIDPQDTNIIYVSSANFSSLQKVRLDDTNALMRVL